ncbi:uroporphyrinogen decarboxylase [Amycolatopsis antarctica]|uniref:Uroporphyrinogen decarboxylase n=1 Tax=Amycolatopsis antarctica TaxID=1854586 RepID=A0A263CYE2_9PSEU|nr:uroporphyrinogen decarboxylase [Amycolatopsis antarctica]OZM71172.1 uroporphyrinogen decarboxylase [Amycolatopsis antarctica]
MPSTPPPAPQTRPTTARRELTDSPYLAAARGGTPARLPVWFMRQAGRSLPEYRALREGTSMLDACFDPEMLAEITMQPVRRHDVDAAILFSDIVVPLKAAGVDIEIVPGTGPVVASPIRTAADVAALPELSPDQVGAVADGVRLLVERLGRTPLIGFAGAPFTLASYLIEGGPSRNHEHTKSLMHSEPEVWHALAGKLAKIARTFLIAQLDAGVDAVQLFDSWAGALSPRDYREFVLPHSTSVLGAVGEYGVPRTHFGVGTGELLTAMRDAGADVVGVDWRLPLDEAVRRLSTPDGPVPVVQGNLDPALLFASWPVIEAEVRRIADEGRTAGGHIVNLGHGVLPGTDPEVLTRVVRLVHELRP